MWRGGVDCQSRCGLRHRSHSNLSVCGKRSFRINDFNRKLLADSSLRTMRPNAQFNRKIEVCNRINVRLSPNTPRAFGDYEVGGRSSVPINLNDVTIGFCLSVKLTGDVILESITKLGRYVCRHKPTLIGGLPNVLLNLRNVSRHNLIGVNHVQFA